MNLKKSLIALVLLGLASCAKTTVTSEASDELAQQVGDVMASIDEIGGPSGYLSLNERSFLKMEDRLNPQFQWPQLIPNAYATPCALAATWAPCQATSRTLTRTYNSCTVGLASFSGSVVFTWSGNGSGCSINTLPPSVNGTITRNPNFTMTGLRGATLAVRPEPSTSSPGYGQRIVHSAGTGSAAVFNFSSDGIRRTFTNPDGSTLIDYTSSSTGLRIAGTARDDSRSIESGTLHVLNHLTSGSCDFVPDQVKWSSTCNCPVSGKWSASCSDGSSTTLVLTGCGTATLTIGFENQTITFDRCFGT